MWPRLYPLLPDPVITGIGQAREALEFLLVLSALATAFGTLSGIYLLVVVAQVWLFLVCFWGALAVALLAYRSSLGAALLYAEVLEVRLRPVPAGPAHRYAAARADRR